MGQCFGKKKNNKVSPSPIEEDVDAALFRGTPFQKQTADNVHYADMVKDLTDDQDARLADAGLSFVVDYREGDASKMPRRLASRMEGAITPDEKDKIEYTSEEKELLAGMMREDFLKTRRQRALRDDVRQYDAARRRAGLARDKERRTQASLDKATPSLNERLQKVKDMAEESRSNVKVIEVKPAADRIDTVKKE